jgi:hypothetical protein
MQSKKMFFITTDALFVSELEASGQLTSSISNIDEVVNEIELSKKLLLPKKNYEIVNDGEIVIGVEVSLPIDPELSRFPFKISCVPIIFIEAIYIDSNDDDSNFRFNIKTIVNRGGIDIRNFGIEEHDYSAETRSVIQLEEIPSGVDTGTEAEKESTSSGIVRKVVERLRSDVRHPNMKFEQVELDSGALKKIDEREMFFLKGSEEPSTLQGIDNVRVLDHQLEINHNDRFAAKYDISPQMASAIIFGLNNFYLQSDKIDCNFDGSLFQLVQWVHGGELHDSDGGKLFREIKKEIERITASKIESKKSVTVFTNSKSSEQSVWEWVISIIETHFNSGYDSTIKGVLLPKKSKKISTVEYLDGIIFDAIVKSILDSPSSLKPNSAHSKLENILTEVLDQYGEGLPKVMTSFCKDAVKVVQYSEGIKKLKRDYPFLKKSFASIVYISSNNHNDFQKVDARKELIGNDREGMFCYWFLFGLKTGYVGLFNAYDFEDKYENSEEWDQLFQLIYTRLVGVQDKKILSINIDSLATYSVNNKGVYIFTEPKLLPAFNFKVAYHGNKDRTYRRLKYFVRNNESKKEVLEAEILVNFGILGLKEWPEYSSIFNAHVSLKQPLSPIISNKKVEFKDVDPSNIKTQYLFIDKDKFYKQVESDEYREKIKKLLLKTEIAWDRILDELERSN